MDTLFDFDLRPPRERVEYKKIQMLYFTPGSHIVRLLSRPRATYTHYLPNQKLTIQCVEDCPVCINNKQIYLEHPKDFNKVPGYISRVYRHYANVLDRTPIKVCPKCSFETKRNLTGLYPANCSKCNTFITSVEEHPSNQVKVINISDTNAQQLVGFQRAVLDKEGNPLGLGSFDILFMTTPGANGKNTTGVSVLPQNNDVVEVPKEELFDLDEIPFRLYPFEVVNLLRGISLRDIFAARRGKENDKLAEEVNSVSNDVQKSIAELFGE